MLLIFSNKPNMEYHMQVSEALLIRRWHARELDIVGTVCNIDVIAMKQSSDARIRL